MTATQEKALASHAAGLNCAQAVVTAYADTLGFDESLAESIAVGFGSGMGRLQETCGAVTGGFMAISIRTSQQLADKAERKAKAYELVQEFNERFTAIHGTKSCRLLLGCDMKTEEGREFYKKNNLSATVCDRCIADSVAIVDALIA
jgi:C_GCAxxG_C_C family probable redox protein